MTLEGEPYMSIDFGDYQESTMETAIYPEAGEGTELALAYVGLGPASEAGEVAGKIKKLIRDSGGTVTEDVRDAIKGELGGVLWYIARVADELDESLEDVAIYNLNQLSSRKQRGVIGGSGDNR